LKKVASGFHLWHHIWGRKGKFAAIEAGEVTQQRWFTCLMKRRPNGARWVKKIVPTHGRSISLRVEAEDGKYG
jgi:hypothetical protein